MLFGSVEMGLTSVVALQHSKYSISISRPPSLYSRGNNRAKGLRNIFGTCPALSLFSLVVAVAAHCQSCAGWSLICFSYADKTVR